MLDIIKASLVYRVPVAREHCLCILELVCNEHMSARTQAGRKLAVYSFHGTQTALFSIYDSETVMIAAGTRSLTLYYGRGDTEPIIMDRTGFTVSRKRSR